jgi:hypothetical protein
MLGLGKRDRARTALLSGKVAMEFYGSKADYSCLLAQEPRHCSMCKVDSHIWEE